MSATFLDRLSLVPGRTVGTGTWLEPCTLLARLHLRLSLRRCSRLAHNLGCSRSMLSWVVLRQQPFFLKAGLSTTRLTARELRNMASVCASDVALGEVASELGYRLQMYTSEELERGLLGRRAGQPGHFLCALPQSSVDVNTNMKRKVVMVSYTPKCSRRYAQAKLAYHPKIYPAINRVPAHHQAFDLRT